MKLPGVKNIVAVASGKGGVGKSTTAESRACTRGRGRPGGSWMPTSMARRSRRCSASPNTSPESFDGKTMQPLEAHGLQVMSIGFLVDVETPMVWRGPMATQALNQMLMGETNWSDLDYLVVDMPPGTGDIQLTLSQAVPVTGAVIVTTPQDIALLDARKGLKMFEKVGAHPRRGREHVDPHLLEMRARGAYLRRGRRPEDATTMACPSSERCRSTRDPRADRFGRADGVPGSRWAHCRALQGDCPQGGDPHCRQVQGHDPQVPQHRGAEYV